MHKLSSFAFLLFSSAGLLRSQSTGASLTGRITDPSNALIAAARVSAINASTNVRYESTTNSSGTYYLTNMPPGPYRVEVEKPDFKKSIEPDVILHVQDALQLDFAMTVGAASESVTVEATINSAPGPIATLVDRQFVENLPLNGRSFQNLFQLAPGVVVATTSPYDQGQFNVNGQRADANYFKVDGVSANFGVVAGPLGQSGGGALPSLTAGGGFNGLASVDAVQEFRIQTSTFSPEYGRMPGAQIEISTRSGTNQLHGTLFNYFRNDKLDASDWFANQQGKVKPAERQNDFGGVLGGAIRKNRTFFFLSYEGLRLRQPQVLISSVPDLALRADVPAALQPILAAYPIPNGPELGGGLAQFSASVSAPTNVDAGSVRVDHTFGKVSLFGRFNDAPSSGITYPGAPIAPSNVQPIQFDSLTATAGANWSISPSLNNEFRINSSRSHGYSTLKLTNLGGAVPFDPSQVLPSFSNPQSSAFTFFCCSFASELFLGTNAMNRQSQFNLVDNLSYVKGTHQLKFGVDFRSLSPTFGRRAYDNQYLYSTAASLLSNTPSQVYVNAASGAAGLRVVTHNFSLFAQDTWRIARRLTLTYGLRWEYNPAPRVANRDAPWVVDQVTNIATTQLVSSGAPLWHASAANFAPRMGVAYQLSGSPRWASVLRGGAGLFYDIGFGQLGDVFASNSQYYGQSIYSSNVTFPLTASQQLPPPLTGTTLPISQAAVYDPHMKLPYTVQWNVTVEQRLGSQQSLTASYVGAVGRRLLLQTYYSRPSPAFNTLFVTKNGATSDYDALQLQLRGQLSHGLQALVSYTWSHSIDTSSADSFYLATAPGRASSNFDIRHTVSGALSYHIPTPKGNEFVRTILRDWSVDSMNVVRSALPISVLSATTFVGGSYTSVFANMQSGAPLFLNDANVACGKRINPAAFTAPAAGQQGNAPRNFLRGFGAWQSDLAVRRQFTLSERFKLQFRSEFFNIFNHPNFANPANTLSNPLFGISTSMLGRSLGSGGTSGGFAPMYQMGGPRSVQLAMKLQF